MLPPLPTSGYLASESETEVACVLEFSLLPSATPGSEWGSLQGTEQRTWIRAEFQPRRLSMPLGDGGGEALPQGQQTSQPLMAGGPLLAELRGGAVPPVPGWRQKVELRGPLGSWAGCRLDLPGFTEAPEIQGTLAILQMTFCHSCGASRCKHT